MFSQFLKRIKMKKINAIYLIISNLSYLIWFMYLFLNSFSDHWYEYFNKFYLLV